MTSRLYNESLSGKWESAYLLAEFKELPPLTIKGLVAAAQFTGRPKYNQAAEFELQRIKNSAIATLKKVSPSTRLNATTKPTSPR